MSPYELRQKIRAGIFTANTSGLCGGFVQANVVILPKEWAQDFLLFCQRNPKPCPLISVSAAAGDYLLPAFGKDFDVRRDVSQYRIWENGVLAQEVPDIVNHWRDDLVTFLIGCSFSFEEALMADGLEIRNISEGVNVPMYRTTIECEPAGRFNANMVVSMRPFTPANAIRMIQICSRFPSVHGAPVHFGNPEAIGISAINRPDFGDAVTINEGEVPVFTACGVTPQEAIARAKPPFCITHSPGCMAVSDLANSRFSIL